MERKSSEMYSSITPIESIRVEELLDIAIRAGEAIMEIYNQPFDVITKRDGSPLTLADKNANKIITDYLFANYTIPILSEENDDISYEIRKDWKQLWIIDPLDGTKEFIHKRREFTVNIALVEHGRPVLGIIYAPIFRELYYAVKNGGCFFMYQNRIEKIRSKPALQFQNKTFQKIQGN